MNVLCIVLLVCGAVTLMCSIVLHFRALRRLKKIEMSADIRGARIHAVTLALMCVFFAAYIYAIATNIRYIDVGPENPVMPGLFLIGAVFSLLVVVGEHRMMHSLETKLGLEAAKRELESRVVSAEAASHAKGEFLSRMSHEMRTPMNAIIGMSGIAKQATTIEKKDYALAQIEIASKHLLGVINDILDISKIEAGKLELSVGIVDMRQMLSKLTGMIGFRVREKGLDFSVDVADDVPTRIVTDEQRLTQALMNLLGNAVKFTPDSGKVSLSISKRGMDGGKAVLAFAVSDTGIGIPLAQQDALFHSFAQANDTVSARYGGTGLGLAISKHIAELLDGDITLVSDEGKGATFTLSIRAQALAGFGADDSADDIDTAEEAAPIEGIFEGVRVLLAEDVDINREIARALLEPTGIEIDEARNGLEAYEAVAADPGKYAMVLMDVQMPEMNGIDATMKIRALEDQRAQFLPILAMTANVFTEDIRECMNAGMSGHIGKPIILDELVEKIKMLLMK